MALFTSMVVPVSCMLRISARSASPENAYRSLNRARTFKLAQTRFIVYVSIEVYSLSVNLIQRLSRFTRNRRQTLKCRRNLFNQQGIQCRWKSMTKKRHVHQREREDDICPRITHVRGNFGYSQND